MLTQSEIINILSHLPFQVEGTSFEMANEVLSFTLNFKVKSEVISFKVHISPWYPYHYMGQEGITFYNETLMPYSHIMEGGNLCLHSRANQKVASKFKEDVTQLYEWIVKYYVNGEKDSHYEDIVVNESKFGEHFMCFAIPMAERPNLTQTYGMAYVKQLSLSIRHEIPCLNYLVYGFQSEFPKIQATNLELSSVYKTKGKQDFQAPFIILKDHPSDYGKFAIRDICKLSELMTQEQLSFISNVLRKEIDTNWKYFPIFIGFPTINNQFGWLTLMIDLDNIPWHGEPEKINGRKTGRWLSVPNKNAVTMYAKTEILTPELYYGRGAFPEDFINSRILILGLGAIGSILARTLAKCGCCNLTLYDFDTKQYNNCCRSEYDFYRGSYDKQYELSLQLTYAHPFVEVYSLPRDFDMAIKAAFQKGNHNEFKKKLNEYDLIFDCTTDDDLAYILDHLQESSQIINLSISNHAHQLVCAFSPNISNFLNFAFSKCVSLEDGDDLFNPTGCWNPTFKASYNDINSLLQYALKRIVRMVTYQEPKHNFILSDSDEGIKINRI